MSYRKNTSSRISMTVRLCRTYWAAKLFVRVARHSAYTHSRTISAPDVYRLKAFATSILRRFPQFLAVESGFVGLTYCVIPLKAVITFDEQYGFDDELAVTKNVYEPAEDTMD